MPAARVMLRQGRAALRRARAALRRARAALRRAAAPVPKQLGALRRVLGPLLAEDAYQRYLRHASAQHPGSPTLSRREFYRDAEQRKWSGVSRCC